MNSKSAKSSPIVTGVIVVICGAVLIALLFPIKTQYGRSPRTHAISQAKQMNLALMMYSADCDERPPFYSPFEFGTDPIDPYIKNPGIHCVSYGHNESEHPKGTSDFQFHYILNPRTIVKGQETRIVMGPLSNIENTPSVPWFSAMFADREGKTYETVGFVDGHVRAISSEKVTRIPPIPGDYPEFPMPGRYLLQVPGYSAIPAHWSVPYQDVESLARVTGRYR